MIAMAPTLARLITGTLIAGVLAVGVVTASAPDVVFTQAGQEVQEETTTTTVVVPTTILGPVITAPHGRPTVPAPTTSTSAAPRILTRVPDTTTTTAAPVSLTSTTAPSAPVTTTTKITWRLTMPDGSVHILNERPNYAVCSSTRECKPAEYVEP